MANPSQIKQALVALAFSGLALAVAAMALAVPGCGRGGDLQSRPSGTEPAAAPASGAGQDVEQVVEVRTLLSRDAVHPGDTFKAAVILKVQPGYHINDNAPRDEFLVPTVLAIDEDSGFEVVEIYYPTGHRGRFAYTQAELIVYEGEATLGAVLKAKPGISKGAAKLKATLSYQACDNTSCLAPRDLPFEIAVSVVEPGKPARDVNGEVFDKIPFKTPVK